ncbi:Polygalacturonase [Granulicella rosea]|uniref:Polygalacturonase n=1 Tax=Granulicella rosea TaxID=474952 RepID=A0A239LYD5_9BACT|nr:glycosyl hydrolase family 28 protein [Granulicella rosea]SNT34813.1 Polygalacturonase [Granulicella rosea]
MIDRRNMLKYVAGSGALAAASAFGQSPVASGDDVKAVGEVLNPRSFGAKGDGKTKDKAAIQKAIDECSKRGGGIVYLSPGVYVTGTILLKNNVNLHLEAGATILGSPDPADYTAPEEMQKIITWAVARHLIIGYKQTNIALTGRGTVDGRSQTFMAPTKNPPPKPDDIWWRTASNTDRTTRISPMVMIVMCHDVLVEGLTLQNAVGWTMRPQGCNRVVIRGVKVRNPGNFQNTDGIDPTSCEDVMISDCDIDTGDDALCIKTDNPYGDNKTCRNVTVTNCIISSACSAFKIGSEGYHHFENITFSNSVIYSPEQRRDDYRIIEGINILMPDGGSIEGVTISNITMRNARVPIWIRLQRNVGHEVKPMKAWLKSVMISDVQAFGAHISCSIMGIPGYPMEDITLRNIRIQTDEPGEAKWLDNVPQERETGYPEAPLFGRMPAFGFYVRHAKNLHMSEIDLVSTRNDPRRMIQCEDVDGLSLRTITGTPPSQGAESILLKNVTDVSISGNYPTGRNHLFVKVQGEKCAEIALFANDLHRAKTPLQVSAEVPAGAIYVDGQPFTARH